jgi:hypothetical protein
MQVTTMIVERKTMAVRITKTGKESRDNLLQKKLCLVCEEPVTTGNIRRGCCAACRQYINRLVASGERSEESFIREGKLLERPEKCRGGRRPHEKRRALRRRSA